MAGGAEEEPEPAPAELSGAEILYRVLGFSMMTRPSCSSTSSSERVSSSSCRGRLETMRLEAVGTGADIAAVGGGGRGLLMKLEFGSDRFHRAKDWENSGRFCRL
jgi:hypothetical protein